MLLTTQVLRETFRSTDILGRAGGDEFLIFMSGVDTPETAAVRAAVLCQTLARRSAELGCSCGFTCSIGVALYPQDSANDPALFEAADNAMYLAKREGKSSYRICTPISDFVTRV